MELQRLQGKYEMVRNSSVMTYLISDQKTTLLLKSEYRAENNTLIKCGSRVQRKKKKLTYLEVLCCLLENLEDDLDP